MTTQLHISPCAYLEQRIIPVQNRTDFGVKPLNGLWTSSFVDGKSAWVDAHEDMLADSRGSAYSLCWFLLEPDPNARVLVIDTLDDLRDVLAAFPLQLFPGSAFVFPDFERIAKYWDAIHLTEAGQWRTRLTNPTLYGWDSESTLWFRWCFTGYRRIEPAIQPTAVSE